MRLFNPPIPHNRLLNKNDDPVEEGEEIAEVMIEKVTVHVKAPASERFKILVKENEEVAQGQVIGLIVA